MSIYLESFTFPDSDSEFGFFWRRPSRFNDFYPAGVLTERLKRVDFAPVTIFYGGNGSGKSTALNLIAEKLEIKRTAPYNKSAFFGEYAKLLCHGEFYNYTDVKKIITSDDVFKGIFDTREKNKQIDKKRDNLCDERNSLKYTDFADFLKGKELLGQLDEIKLRSEAKRKTLNAFVKARSERNIQGKSNGENALEFFENAMCEGGLYLLDEPENSLSSAFCKKLSVFLANSARYFACQLIIATHSPFMLSIPGAKIYDLDKGVITYNWAELENMRIYYEFFKENRGLFE